MEAVDLGLSVMWADRNFGAEEVGDFGFYVGWGPGWNGWTCLKHVHGRIVHLPEGWRLPSYRECEELVNRCYVHHEPGSGATITGPSGESVFFPYGGYYDDEFKVEPSKVKDLGNYLSSSYSSGYARFLTFGLVSGRYQHYFLKMGRWGIKGNVRLVKKVD